MPVCAIMRSAMKTVWLVDPDARAMAGLKAGFPWEESGFAVADQFTSLSQCLRCEGGRQPLLVIAEIDHPGQSAREALQSLRACFPCVHLAILTGDERLSSARAAFGFGVLRYLLKPFVKEEIQELLDAVNDAARQAAPLLPGAGSSAAEELNIAQRIQDYVNARYTSPALSLKRIAEEFHLNYSYLSSLFKKQTGLKYSAYVRSMRIRLAKQLLGNTRMTMSEVARASGFQDAQVFYYAFKNAAGVTPKAYRSRKSEPESAP